MGFTTFILSSAFLFSTSLAKAETADCYKGPSGIIPMSVSNMQTLSKVMQAVSPTATIDEKEEVDYPVFVLDESKNKAEKESSKIAMQIGMGGNPDEDNGKPFREGAGTISILYPVKVTSAAGIPTTVYAEARCVSLGKQPASAQTGNINVRCGPGVVVDAQTSDRLSVYGRLGIVTSRFSHNGAPQGQINPLTGREFRLYPNNTGFTGAAMGGGVKLKLAENAVVFTEYTKYLVQQTDNPKYQFRGGWNFGVARKFWLFQRGQM